MHFCALWIATSSAQSGSTPQMDVAGVVYEYLVGKNDGTADWFKWPDLGSEPYRLRSPRPWPGVGSRISQAWPHANHDAGINSVAARQVPPVCRRQQGV